MCTTLFSCFSSSAVTFPNAGMLCTAVSLDHAGVVTQSYRLYFCVHNIQGSTCLVQKVLNYFLGFTNIYFQNGSSAPGYQRWDFSDPWLLPVTPRCKSGTLWNFNQCFISNNKRCGWDPEQGTPTALYSRPVWVLQKTEIALIATQKPCVVMTWWHGFSPGRSALRFLQHSLLAGDGAVCYTSTWAF